MENQDLIKVAEDFVQNSEDNYISKDIAISQNLVGMKIFDTPILGFACPDDEYFNLLKSPSVIGEHFIHPKEWLEGSKTVISIFLPFSDSVRKGNIRDRTWPSEEWLHGRIEGQILVNKLSDHLNSKLLGSGYHSLVPTLDDRFSVGEFTSNWSERHIAFGCGLGTFGLSKGLITKKGLAGRFVSIITELYLSPDKREYKDTYEYCSMCGECVINCPVNAISIENGKDHLICSRFLEKTKEKYSPRYGCGKCQIDTPCESRIPSKQ